jgi:Tfp pilus assembly protein FimT
MLIVSKRVAIVGLLCIIAAPASAQLIQRKDLSYAMAKTIAENALADCRARAPNQSHY